ncbi:MAG: HAD hydrolase family protein, partial [Cyanobacteria bacterium P01_H01_bin.152]
MQYRAIATDYDGTLASDGVVDEATWKAVAAFGQSGRQMILVTGRQLNELAQVCPHLDRFAAVVAENGAVLHWPSSGHTQLLGNPPPPEFIDRLQQAGVETVDCGDVIVATWQPHGATVQATVAAMQLDFQVILNKRAVMVL